MPLPIKEKHSISYRKCHTQTTIAKGGENSSKKTRLFLVTSATSKNLKEPTMAKHTTSWSIYVEKQPVRKEKET